jgi:hypothetical protein
MKAHEIFRARKNRETISLQPARYFSDIPLISTEDMIIGKLSIAPLPQVLIDSSKHDFPEVCCVVLKTYRLWDFAAGSALNVTVNSFQKRLLSPEM